jgi:hypothetical protein
MGSRLRGNDEYRLDDAVFPWVPMAMDRRQRGRLLLLRSWLWILTFVTMMEKGGDDSVR